MVVRHARFPSFHGRLHWEDFLAVAVALGSNTFFGQLLVEKQCQCKAKGCGAAQAVGFPLLLEHLLESVGASVSIHQRRAADRTFKGHDF